MKRVLSLLLVIFMLPSMAVPGYAAEVDTPVVTPRYTHIHTNRVVIVINETTGIAQCSSYCYTVGNYNVEVVCRLQRYSGGMWSTIKSWSATGTQYARAYGEWAVASGYTYRAYTTYYVRDSAGNLLENASSSDSYSYPKQ